ncbi:MAG TPA: TcfC E-set like domain-containing protein [Sphingomicrobium sp.]|nr:TcfC E-set like domain-containing protein [Sphingomicrobium sp.]
MIPAAPATAGANLTADGTPEGFTEIASPKVMLVDVYYGGRKIAETLALVRPGILQFRSPDEVFAKLPQAIEAVELRSALADELPTNTGAACSMSNVTHCGNIDPQVAGIIYDEDRFRVDIFVNPKFLQTIGPDSDVRLPIPASGLSLTNSLGFTASGSLDGPPVYNMQNRTVVGLHNARLRANTSVASGLGLIVDDLVAEIDTRTLRYSAGLFWGPGNEFTGQRRMIGAGVGTQFDTFADQEAIRGTPLILFLAQPARVEVLVDGRLIGSRSYGAGNNTIETSGFPGGSYPVLLRIHRPDGSVREERRFFVKNGQIPPAGHPIFHAYAGVLANTQRHRPISVSGTFYYQAGAALRLSNSLAADVSLFGTQDKAILQAGGWLIKGPARVRAAALVSSSGDAGGLLQASTSGTGPLTISFDLRRIWSRDDRPLIPLPSYASTFDLAPPSGVQLANGSYTQATASVGLRLGDGFLSVVGSYRKDRHLRADYAIGPSINWPVLTRNRMQIVLEASAQRTRSTMAGFAGVRVALASGPLSMQSRVGQSFQSDRDGDASASRAVSSFSAQYSHETDDRTLINLEGGLDRDIGSSTVHGGGTLTSRFGNLRADVLHRLEGRGGTQYDIAFQSGLALGPGVIALGARDMEQSALIVAVEGDAREASFDVLVDEVVRGRVHAGRNLSLFVPGYRRYKVRLVPTAASAVSYDAAAREVTLYPGNVQTLDWKAEPYVTVFAQAISASGEPIANALVETAKGVAETDSDGYFQVDVRQGDPVTISKGNAAMCQIHLPKLIVRNDFASAGKAVCK